MSKYIIFIAIILLSACGGAKQANEEPVGNDNGTTVTITDAQSKNAGIQTGPAQVKSLSSMLKVMALLMCRLKIWCLLVCLWGGI